jgi:hypothetical protein
LFFREEAVQSGEELLEDHDVVSSVFKVVVPGGEFDLESDVFEDREDDLAYDFSPEVLTKVGVVLFEGLFERVEGFFSNCFVFLSDQASEISENWEPELLKSAKTNSFRRAWNWTSFCVCRFFFGGSRNSLLKMILILNTINSIRFHIFLIL